MTLESLKTEIDDLWGYIYALRKNNTENSNELSAVIEQERRENYELHRENAKLKAENIEQWSQLFDRNEELTRNMKINQEKYIAMEKRENSLLKELERMGWSR